MASVTAYVVWVVLSASPSSRARMNKSHREIAGSGGGGLQLRMKIIQPLACPSIEGRCRAATRYG